jgi:DNA end-binding protein Ku
MAVRPSWEGHLRLSLVTCPVALYPATSEAETVRFNLINPQTNNRIKMKTVDAGTGEEVSAATWSRASRLPRTSMSCSTRRTSNR